MNIKTLLENMRDDQYANYSDTAAERIDDIIKRDTFANEMELAHQLNEMMQDYTDATYDKGFYEGFVIAHRMFQEIGGKYVRRTKNILMDKLEDKDWDMGIFEDVVKTTADDRVQELKEAVDRQYLTREERMNMQDFRGLERRMK